MTKKSLQEWLDYWLSQTEQEIHLGLDRVNQVKNQMNWVISQPIITVGGTNGKGSTCAFLTQIYYQAGYKVGTLSSPHLLHYNERICINGLPVLNDQIILAFETIDNKRKDIALTYFEANVLAAIEIFLNDQVDLIILEVGMGGRLDAVNIFNANIAIVTNVDFDHQEYLGDTREKIAYEKAGIFRAHQPAIIGEVNPPDILTQFIVDLNAVKFCLGSDYYYEQLGNQWSFHFAPSHTIKKTERHRFALPMPTLRGVYQLNNASVALCAIECLYHQMPVDIGAIKKGLLLVTHPARFQILPGRPMVILDVGHNPHAAQGMKDSLLLLPYAKTKIAVFSMLADKDIDAVLDLLKDEFDAWYIATLNTDRALSCVKIEQKLLTHGIQNIKLFNSIIEAYHSALSDVSDKDRIVVFGSFFTVAAVMT